MSEHRVIRPYSPGPEKRDSTPCVVAGVIAALVVAALAYAGWEHFNKADAPKTEQAAQEAEQAAQEAKATNEAIGRAGLKWLLFAGAVVVSFVVVVGGYGSLTANASARNHSNERVANFFGCLLVLVLLGGYVWAGFLWQWYVLT